MTASAPGGPGGRQRRAPLDGPTRPGADRQWHRSSRSAAGPGVDRRRQGRRRPPAGREPGDRAAGRRSAFRPAGAQCRKWRTPVRSIVAPAASATAITSASRTEPPGWTKARDARRRGRPRPRRGTGRRRPRRRRRRRVESGAGDRLRLGDRLAGGVDPARLARAEADQPARPGRGRWRCSSTPRTSRQARSRSRRLRCASGLGAVATRPVGRVVGGVVAAASTRIAPPAVRIEPNGSGPAAGRRAGGRAPGRRPGAGSAWRARIVERRRLEARARRHLEEDRRERLGQRRVDRPGQGDDPAEGRDGIAGEGRLPGLEERRAARRRRTDSCA